MPSVVVKPFRDRDEYVVWSTVTESPHGYGTRAEVVELLRAGIRGGGEDRRDPESPVRRADHWGSSAMGGWTEGHWEDEFVIYHQAGLLPRDRLFEAARLMDGGCPEREVLRLLEPFEDEDEDDVADRLAWRIREAGDEVVSLESERRMAGLALGQIRREIERWNH